MNLLLPASSLLWIIAPASTNNPSGSGQRTQNHLPNSPGALRVYTYGIWVNRRTKYILGSHEFFNSETSFCGSAFQYFSMTFLVYSPDLESNLQHLQQVFNLLSTDQWQVKPSRCHCAQQSGSRGQRPWCAYRSNKD